MCYKLQRMSSQDGPVGSSNYLHARQRVTSNVQTATLDVCSDYAHSNRAIVPKLSWTSAVRQGNKFPQREVKQARRLSDTTDAGACEHGLQTGKPERLTRMTVYNIYKVPAIIPAKSPGKRTAQFKPMTLNSSSKCIPVSIHCLSTGIYHNDSPLYEIRPEFNVVIGRE